MRTISRALRAVQYRHAIAVPPCGTVAASARTAPAACQLVAASRRRGFASATPATQDTITFPRERPGLDYALNWSLATDDVTAAGDAYRNPSPELLAGKLRAKGGSATLQAPGLAGGPPVLEAGGEAMDFEMFDELRHQVLQHLSCGVELFVVDAAVGAGDVQVGVRVVSDSAACALLARNLLVRVPDAAPCTQPVIVYLASGVSDTASALAAVQYEEGDKGALAGATVLLAGMPSQATLTTAIFKAASALLLEMDAVAPLPAAVLTGKGGKTGLYVGMTHEDTAAALAKNALVAAHHSIWSPAGLLAFWGGATAGGSSGRSAPAGELAAVVGGVVCAPLAGSGGKAAAAPAAVFVGGASGSLDAAAVAKALKAAGAEEDCVERLAAAMQANNTPAIGVKSAAAAIDHLNK